MADRIVAFPLYESQACGFPPTVRLTKAESVAMERVHLGGIESLCTQTYRTTGRLITSLVAKGLLDSRGPTMLGRRVGQSLAEADFA